MFCMKFWFQSEAASQSEYHNRIDSDCFPQATLPIPETKHHQHDINYSFSFSNIFSAQTYLPITTQFRLNTKLEANNDFTLWLKPTRVLFPWLISSCNPREAPFQPSLDDWKYIPCKNLARRINFLEEIPSLSFLAGILCTRKLMLDTRLENSFCTKRYHSTP